MKSVIFLGDSLTEGSLSYDWVNNINKDIKLFDVINKGTNGLTVCTLYDKLLNEITFDNPDYVVLMIGGNDIIGSMSEENGIFYMKIAPNIQNEEPSLDNYVRYLREIINKLDRDLPLNTYLIVLSAPPIGEGGENSKEWKLGGIFNNECKLIVNDSTHRVIYKDLFNAVLIDMNKHINKQYTNFKLSIATMYIASFLSYFFTWETVRWIIGFKYTTDGVHFGKEFGNICEGLVLETIADIEDGSK